MQQSDELASKFCQKSHNLCSEDGFGGHTAKQGHMNVWFLWICHPCKFVLLFKMIHMQSPKNSHILYQNICNMFLTEKRWNQTHMLLSAHDWFGLSVPAIALLHFQLRTSLRSVHQVHWETVIKTKHHVPGCPGKQSCFAQNHLCVVLRKLSWKQSNISHDALLCSGLYPSFCGPHTYHLHNRMHQLSIMAFTTTLWVEGKTGFSTFVFSSIPLHPQPPKAVRLKSREKSEF